LHGKENSVRHQIGFHSVGGGTRVARPGCDFAGWFR
jgi:hypothetical protein